MEVAEPHDPHDQPKHTPALAALVGGLQLGLHGSDRPTGGIGAPFEARFRVNPTRWNAREEHEAARDSYCVT